MIFDVLKQQWLRKECIRLGNSSRDQQRYWPESLVVVFNADQFDDLEVFKKWCGKLDISSNKMTLLGYTKNVKKKYLEGATLFDPSAIKWKGGVKDDHLSELLNSKYDLQINYYEVSSQIKKFITMRLNSSIKVGYATHEEITYDLAVNVPLTNQELFISEIAKYLKIFNP
jgi:hypothetical protein